MKNLKKYTLPVFMTISGILTTVADLIQKNEIAIILAVVLGVIGAVALFFPSSILNKATATISDIDASQGDFSFKSLGASCLLLSAAVFGFSTLSAKAAPEGGIIASQYPEIRQIQDVLGIMQTDVAEIKGQVKDINDKSDKIIAATFPWMELYFYVGFPSSLNSDEGIDKLTSIGGGTFVSIRNESPINFEDVIVRIESLQKDGDIFTKEYDFISSNVEKNGEMIFSNSAYDDYSVCISAKIRGKNEWVIDEYKVKSNNNLQEVKGSGWYDVKYDKLSYGGPSVHLTERKCR